MGTNYYLHEKFSDDACGESILHIGKSSAGWCFSLHVIPAEGLNTLADWEERWSRPGRWIRDEYGELVAPWLMLVIIRNRSRFKPNTWYGYRDEAHFHESNHSQPGPNGLVRCKIDGRYCIGHGEGAWDYLPGEFS